MCKETQTLHCLKCTTAVTNLKYEIVSTWKLFDSFLFMFWLKFLFPYKGNYYNYFLGSLNCCSICLPFIGFRNWHLHQSPNHNSLRCPKHLPNIFENVCSFNQNFSLFCTCAYQEGLQICRRHSISMSLIFAA